MLTRVQKLICRSKDNSQLRARIRYSKELRYQKPAWHFSVVTHLFKYIEHLAENNVTEETDTDGYGKITQTVRLWLTFDSKRVGTKARWKAKPYMTCKRNVLRSDWPPIRQQSVSIGLGRGKLIKCRRIQFPISSACAITIHKSQGGTFQQIVMQYKRQDQRLVYVGMSSHQSRPLAIRMWITKQRKSQLNISGIKIRRSANKQIYINK